MKKHELLKYAYDNYPIGTVARFGGKAPDHTSTGRFEITDLNKNGDIQVMSENGLECFYSNGEWAVPVAPSILTDKCAIQIINEREFKLLMEHYEAKGWNWYGDTKRSTEVAVGRLKNMDVNYIEYCDKFCQSSEPMIDCVNIPFADFAKEVGIEVPVFVIKSEDGVNLYEGDAIYTTRKYKDGSKWNASLWKRLTHQVINALKVEGENLKGFYTREAAEKWTADQNKPKEVTIQLFNQYHSARVTKDWIIYRVESQYDKFDQVSTMIKPSDLEDMLHAYKSLQ